MPINLIVTVSEQRVLRLIHQSAEKRLVVSGPPSAPSVLAAERLVARGWLTLRDGAHQLTPAGVENIGLLLTCEPKSDAEHLPEPPGDMSLKSILTIAEAPEPIKPVEPVS